MAPNRTSEKGLQTLLRATAQVVASSSPTPSQRSTFSMRPPRVHRDLPRRSAFSATAFLTGREGNDEAKRQSMTTTTCGNVVSHECKSVSDAQRLVRRSGRDTPSSTLSSTDGELAYLTGTRAPTYVRPVPLLPLLRPALRPFYVAQVGPLIHLACLQKYRASHQRHNAAADPSSSAHSSNIL